jgi:hypothetical protein
VIIKKKAEESLKHKDLTTEVQRMWNVISAVITGASGTISKLFRECLNEIPGKRDLKSTYTCHTGICIVCILGKVQI